MTNNTRRPTGKRRLPGTPASSGWEMAVNGW